MEPALTVVLRGTIIFLFSINLTFSFAFGDLGRAENRLQLHLRSLLAVEGQVDVLTIESVLSTTVVYRYHSGLAVV